MPNQRLLPRLFSTTTFQLERSILTIPDSTKMVLDHHTLDLGRHNVHLTKADEDFVGRVVRRKMKSLVPLRLKIEAARQALSGLEALEREMEYDIAFLRSLASPIRRVPPEILCQIFLLVCQGEYIDIDMAEDKAQFSPESHPVFALCSVSKHWRTIALGLHGLWTRAHVHARDGLGESPYAGSSLNTIIRRSGLQPLDIQVTGLRQYCRELGILIDDGIKHDLGRARTLRLSKMPLNVLDLFGTFSGLQELVLENCRLEQVITVERMSEGSKVVIVDLVFDDGFKPFTSLELPWASVGQLTLLWNVQSDEHSTLPSRREEEFFWALRQFVNLTTLRINLNRLIFVLNLSPAQRNRSVHLPHLRLMEVQDDHLGTSLLGDKLAAFVVPALEQFDLVLASRSGSTAYEETLAGAVALLQTSSKLQQFRVLAGRSGFTGAMQFIYEEGHVYRPDMSTILVDFKRESVQDFVALQQRVFQQGLTREEKMDAFFEEVRESFAVLATNFDEVMTREVYLEDMIGWTLENQFSVIKTGIRSSGANFKSHICAALGTQFPFIEAVINMLCNESIPGKRAFIFQAMLGVVPPSRHTSDY